MKKILIMICLYLLIANQIFSQNFLAPNSFMRKQDSSFYPANWDKTKEMIVEALFNKDKRDAEKSIADAEYNHNPIYFNKQLYLEYTKNIENNAIKSIISVLENFKQSFPDDFSSAEEQEFKVLIKQLRKLKQPKQPKPKKNRPYSKNGLGQLYSLQKWYIRAQNYSQVGFRSYKSKDQIRQMNIWELPIWPVHMRKKKSVNSKFSIPFPVLDFNLGGNTISDAPSSLKELIKNQDQLQNWLETSLKYLSNNKLSKEWWKSIALERTRSLADLSGIESPFKDTFLSSKKELSNSKNKFRINWVNGRLLVSQTKEGREENIEYVFHSLYNAIRSAYIHQLTTLTDNILLYQKVSSFFIKFKDSLDNPHSPLFHINNKDIEEIKNLIGSEFNSKWGSEKKEIWEVLGLATQFINQTLSSDVKELSSSLDKLSLKYRALADIKKDIMKNVRKGKINTFYNVAVKRDRKLLSDLKEIESLIKNSKFPIAVIKLYNFSKSLENTKEPEFYLIQAKIYPLIKALKNTLIDVKKVFSLYSVLQNQVNNSQSFHQLMILYVDTFLTLKREKNSSKEKIIEKTFQTFINNNNLYGEKNARLRAFWWAKLNQFVRVSYSENSPKTLFDTTSRFIRVVENSNSIDLILRDRTLLIDKLFKTRNFLKSLQTSRKFDHLIREDLIGIANALAIDYALDEKEKNKLLSCVLNEQRLEYVKKNLLTKNAA